MHTISFARVVQFEVFQSYQDGQYYFHLRVGNGQIVLQSEGYTSKQNAQKPPRR